MRQGLLIRVSVCAQLAALLLSSICAAAVPQVPSLPSQTAGYVNYAVTSLPAAYKAAAVANNSNTPASNPITDAGATLGRVLFYDKRLSHTNGVACASCHKQSNGFSDPSALSQGVNGTTARHSMALTDVGYFKDNNGDSKAFWDERVNSLEEQALVPIQNSVEMGSTLNEVVGKLNATTFYPNLFQAAFGTQEINSDRIAKAISQFERSMVSYQSNFDKSLSGQYTMTAAEAAGQTIFNGPAGKCNGCHATNTQSIDRTHNTGLDLTVTDVGAGNGQFKAPSLRNIQVRGSYMHDGRFTTLQQVLNFYNTGVQNNPFLDPGLKTAGPNGVPITLGLNSTRLGQLEAFLDTLTDTTFLTSSLFSDPFVTLPGDYNGDGVVDAADYDVWRQNYGDTTSLLADGNSNGVVDMGDYVLWRQNLGKTWQSAGAGSGAQLGVNQVPEPTAFALIAVMFAWAFPHRRRRRSTN